MREEQGNEETGQEASFVIHTEPATITLILKMKKWIPRQVWVLLGRIFMLWLCILVGLYISTWTAWWMVNQLWVSPTLGGDIQSLCWLLLTTTSCGVCLATWLRPAFQAWWES